MKLRPEPATELAVLGGGCFWCMEALVESLNGVQSAVSGYADNVASTAFLQNNNKTAEPTEVVKVVFHPSLISYADLLRIFLTMHNPTINFSVRDKGHKYRSAIFYKSTDQKQIAEQVIGEMQVHFDKPILTAVVPLSDFQPAPPQHQQYYKNDHLKPYCQVVISPKLIRLRRLFSGFVKQQIVSYE